MWFLWITTFIYWLIYLFTETKTKTIYDRENYTDNIYTAWSLYSIANLAH